MVSVAAAQIEKVLAEIKEAAQGGIIDKVRQRTEDSLVLTIRTKSRPLRLLISASRDFPRMHLVSESPPSGITSPLLQSLRKRAVGGRLGGFRQKPGERVVSMEIRRPDDGEGRTYRLIAELTGAHSNIVLADEEGKVVSCIRNFRGRKRTIAPGEVYVSPAATGVVPPKEEEDAELEAAAARLGSYNGAIEERYQRLEEEGSVAEKAKQLGKALRSQKAKAERLVAKLHAKREAAGRAEGIRREGELLKAHMGEVCKGMKEICLPDFGASGGRVKIQLDPRLSPAENLERCFRRYRKAKASAAGIDEQIASAEERMGQLEAIAERLSGVSSLEEVERLEEEAAAEGLVPRKPEKPARPKRRDPLAPSRFSSADEFDMLVGRNKIQNDHLVLHLARGNDMWLHVQGAEGSHVVVRVPSGKSVPKETLLDAANLAVHFSKMRKSGSGHIVYAQCKHVRKPKGSPPGHFTYSNNKSLYIRLDPVRLERIFQTKR